MKPKMHALFGTRRRTQVLEAIALLEETNAAEIALVLNTSLIVVQRILKKLEEEGVLVGKRIGRIRRIELNRRYFAYEHLKNLLLQMAMRDPEVDDAAANLRRRTRAEGKEL